MSQTTTSHLIITIGPPRPFSSTISLHTTSPTDTTSTTTPSSTTTLTTSTISTTGTTTAPTSGTSGAITLTGIASASVPHITLPITKSVAPTTSTPAASASNPGAIQSPGYLLSLPALVMLMWIGFFTFTIRTSRH
ncbi:hypothetical protein N431DRAFT_347004 [Stipitochalara longipes BDJ]|nr:hypothetical protein N431DRAFT_347004 [Stipitochalara longipes BDJ]